MYTNLLVDLTTYILDIDKVMKLYSLEQWSPCIQMTKQGIYKSIEWVTFVIIWWWS